MGMMDEKMFEELHEIGRVMLGGYAVNTDINRVQCDSQMCHEIATHTVTCKSPLTGGILERHLCDKHFTVFQRAYPMMEQSPPELPPPAVDE